MKKEILCSYKSYVNDIEWWAEMKRENIQENIDDLTLNKNDCKKNTKLYHQYDNDINLLYWELKLSDEDLKDKYEDEYYETMSIWWESYWEDFKEIIKDEWKEWIYILKWSAWLWNWRENIDLIKTFDTFDEFFRNLNSVDYIETKYYKWGYLDWSHSHHDWSNSYELVHIDNYSKEEIKEMIRKYRNYSDEELLIDSKYYEGKPFSQLNLKELKHFLLNIID